LKNRKKINKGLNLYFMNFRYLLVILLIYPFYANSQDYYTLQRCIETGLKENYDIKIIRNEQQISDNNMTIGNAGYLPTVDLNAGYTGRTITEGGELNQNLNAGVNVNWTAFDGFNIQAGYKRLKELQLQGEINTRLTIENFIADISAEYYNYVQQNIQLSNLKYAVKLSKERLRIVEARYEIGSLSRLDLQQARVDFNSDSSRLIKQYEVLHVSRTKMNELMAVNNIEENIITADSIIEFNPLLDYDNIYKMMLSTNALLILVQKDKSLSEIDLKIAQSQNYPYLRLNAGYGFDKNMYGNGSSDPRKNWGFNYGVTVGFNIFSGFNRKREQKNARIRIQNSNLKYEQLELSLKAELSNIWMAYKNNMELTGLEKENLETAKENYEIAIERYKLGDLSGIELREAQNSLLEAEERLVQAQYSTKLCEISLVQISGQIINYLQ